MGEDIYYSTSGVQQNGDKNQGGGPAVIEHTFTT